MVYNKIRNANQSVDLNNQRVVETFFVLLFSLYEQNVQNSAAECLFQQFNDQLSLRESTFLFCRIHLHVVC